MRNLVREKIPKGRGARKKRRGVKELFVPKFLNKRRSINWLLMS